MPHLEVSLELSQDARCATVWTYADEERPAFVAATWNEVPSRGLEVYRDERTNAFIGLTHCRLSEVSLDDTHVRALDLPPIYCPAAGPAYTHLTDLLLWLQHRFARGEDQLPLSDEVLTAAYAVADSAGWPYSFLPSERSGSMRAYWQRTEAYKAKTNEMKARFERLFREQFGETPER